MLKTDKGKPAERQRRKAMGLPMLPNIHDCQAAELRNIDIIAHAIFGGWSFHAVFLIHRLCISFQGRDKNGKATA
jgi:hypothetical protein